MYTTEDSFEMMLIIFKDSVVNSSFLDLNEIENSLSGCHCKWNMLSGFCEFHKMEGKGLDIPYDSKCLKYH